MSVACYSWCKGVNLDRKSWVESCRWLAGIFITFQQLLYPLWSPAVLTLFGRWVRPTVMREWGWLCANLLHFKQSQTQLINQPLSHPITSSPVLMVKQWSIRCRCTVSCNHRPAHRQLRPYGCSSLTGAEVMFGSRLSVWAALLRTVVLTTEKVLQTLLYFTLAGLSQLVGTSLNVVETRKQRKYLWTSRCGTSAC